MMFRALQLDSLDVISSFAKSYVQYVRHSCKQTQTYSTHNITQLLHECPAKRAALLPELNLRVRINKWAAGITHSVAVIGLSELHIERV
jgi:hypothetical protein